MSEEDVEKRLKEIEADVFYCEGLLNSEVRLDLVKRMLEDLLKDVRNLSAQKLPDELKARLSDLELKIRIMYHRANPLLSLQEEQGKYSSL